MWNKITFIFTGFFMKRMNGMKMTDITFQGGKEETNADQFLSYSRVLLNFRISLMYKTSFLFSSRA
jgi:hypothetical protein